jgi:heme exporter protein B
MISTSLQDWFRGVSAVFLKDLHLELRNRYALNVLLMFVLSSSLVVAFSIGTEAVSTRTQAALLWIVITFSASLGLGRSFIAEEERGTVLLLQLNIPGSQIFAGKLLFNTALLLSVNVIALFVLTFLLNSSVTDWQLMIATMLLGSIGLAGATTLLSAIVARAASSNALLPVLLLPLLIPLLLSVVRATQNSLPDGLGWAASIDHLVTLFAFGGVVISASVLLFDYVWND